MEKEYVRQLERFNLRKIVNLSLTLFIIAFVLAVIISVKINENNGMIFDLSFKGLVIFIVGYIILMFLHEGIHAIGFIVFGKAKKEDVSFGVIIKQGMIYCTTKKPLLASAYKISVILPLIITGLIPLIVVIISGHFNYIFLFSLLVSGAAGDITMFNRIKRLNKNQLILDHPKAPAYYLMYEKGQEPAGFKEVTAKEEEELEKDLNKILNRKEKRER